MIFNSQGDAKLRQYINGQTITPGDTAITLPKGAQLLGDVTIEAVDTEAAYEEGYAAGYSVGYEEGYAAALPYSTKLRYIESTGAPYINSRFTPNQNSKIEIKFYTTNANAAVAGSCIGWGNTGFATWGESAVYGNQIGYHNSHNAGETILTLDKNKLYINGALNKTFTSATFTTPGNLLLLAININGSTDTTGTKRLFYCKIWDNDVLMRDFIPVLDNNGSPCLYCNVGKTLYYNQGSGSFSYAA